MSRHVLKYARIKLLLTYIQVASSSQLVVPEF